MAFPEFEPWQIVTSAFLHASLSHIALTTVAQDTQQLTSLAIARATARLDGASISERELVVPPHLIIRSTTAPPNGSMSR